MLLRGEQLPSQVERGLRPVYAIHGDDPLLVIEAADTVRAAARRHGYDEREVLTVTGATGFDWGQLLLATGNLSLFGGRKLVDLRIPGGKPGRDGSAILQRYAAHPSPDAVLLVTLPALDWREEKAAWLTALGEAGALVKCTAPSLSELPAWIADRLRRQGQETSREGLAFIAERVEGNLLAAQQEIRKLGLLYPPGVIPPEQIRHAVLDVARYDLDTLREALLAGDATRITRTLDGLAAEGEAPPLVLWALTEEIRALAMLSAGLAAGRPLDGLLRDANVRGARQQSMRRALDRLGGTSGSRRAREALRRAGEIDRMIKGLAVGDVWNEFLRLALAVAAPRAAAT